MRKGGHTSKRFIMDEWQLVWRGKCVQGILRTSVKHSCTEPKTNSTFNPLLVTFQLVFSAISWANLFSRPHTHTPPHTAFQIEINMVSYVDIVAQRT